MKKTILAVFVVSALLLGIVGFVAATSTQSTDLVSPSQNWMAYSYNPGTGYLWGISRVTTSTGVVAPIQSSTSNSFLVYLYHNYNYGLTSTNTITANVAWTPDVTYVNRAGANDGAYVRLEFQDTTSGAYNMNDYWWYNGNGNGVADLNSPTTGQLTASLNPADWSNICGKFGNDHTPYPSETCGVPGMKTTDVSPAEGFANAMKNVKLIGLSFGRASRFASGVAVDGGTGTFNITDFQVN